MVDNIVSFQASAQKDGSPFDNIRRVDEDGKEFWSARELMDLLGYAKWRFFGKAIQRAIKSSQNAGDSSYKHFLLTSVKSHGRPAEDYRLSRYGCYQNREIPHPPMRWGVSREEFFFLERRIVCAPHRKDGSICAACSAREIRRSKGRSASSSRRVKYWALLARMITLPNILAKMHSADRAGLILPKPITLFELSSYNSASLTDVFRFCNEYGVIFNQNAYQPLGAIIESIPIKSEGAIAVAKITVNDVQGVFSTLYRQYSVEGSELRVFKTDSRFLGLTNSNKIHGDATFTVSHAENIKPKESMDLILNPRIMDLARPHGRTLGTYCEAKAYKDGVTCPYAGGLPTCNRTVQDCKAHFGSAVPLPFLGLPAGLTVEQAKGWG